MRFKNRAVLGALAVAAAMTPALAVASPAQAATCSSYLRVDAPARSGVNGYGRVYIKDGATACYNKRIVIYIQIKGSSGSWSSLLSGKHYLATDSDGTGFTMNSVSRQINCNAIVRSAYQRYNNAAGTGGALTVTGTEHRLPC